MWYSLFIFSFGIGFYILLHKDTTKAKTESEKETKEGACKKEDDFPFFNDIGLSLVKTFTMFVGELEFADLPFETPVGYLFLLSFVFLIVVVMMNLLNGLAVSDTGVIREEAEIYAYTCQVEIVSYLVRKGDIQVKIFSEVLLVQTTRCKYDRICKNISIGSDDVGRSVQFLVELANIYLVKEPAK